MSVAVVASFSLMPVTVARVVSVGLMTDVGGGIVTIGVPAERTGENISAVIKNEQSQILYRIIGYKTFDYLIRLSPHFYLASQIHDFT